MRATGSWFGLAALLVMGTAAWAQEGSAGERPTLPARIARREANVVRVDGVPTVLVWARGLQEASDLDLYAELGMNTVYLLVEGVSEEELAEVRALAEAAEARGLLVVVALAPGALLDAQGGELAADPGSEGYLAAVGEFVDAAVEGVGGVGAVIAWSVEAVAPEDVVWGDAGFQACLEGWYGSVAGVNASWGTEFEEWEEIGVAGVLDVDTMKPGGLGRASVDFAYYRQEAYGDVLSVWAEAVGAADPERMVLASALTDYRSIIGVRDDFDGMVLNTYPSVAEADWETHNVHAVDIGRRANQFAVVQTLEVGGRTQPEWLVTWSALALEHGAAGVGFSSWGEVRDSEAAWGAVQQIMEGIEEAGQFPVEPRPRAAIVYDAVAGGALRNDQGLYGYLDGYAPRELSTALGFVRYGSRFGQFDVLSVGSIPTVGLDEYGVVIAPMVLYLPREAQLSLQEFVMSGGVLLADAGIGMYQAGGVVTSVPTVLREVLGLRYDSELEDMWATEVPGEVSVGEPGGYGVPLTELPEEAGQVYNEDMRRLAGIVGEVLGRPEVAEYLGVEFLNDEAPRVRVNGLGEGYSVYTPMFLYEEWDPADAYFTELHARVLGEMYDVEVLEPEGLWPGVSAAVYRDWSVGLASLTGAPASVAVYGAGNQVYEVPAGAMRLADPAEGDWVELLFPGALLAVARPVPVYVFPMGEGAVATVSVLQYDGERVELLVHGTGSAVRVGAEGVGVAGGASTEMEIVIEEGAYRVQRGSLHRVVVREGSAERRGWEQQLMPNPDTGALVIRGQFGWSRLVVEPVAD